MSTIIPLIWSKSHSERTWSCPREEYWHYVWGGNGLRLRTVEGQFDLVFGQVLHQAAHVITTPAISAQHTGQTWTPTAAFSAALTAAQTLIAADLKLQAPSLKLDAISTQQWTAIGHGLATAFFLHYLPLILAEFDVVDIERPMVWPLDQKRGIWFVCKPDLVLRHKRTRKLWYWEHKTTGTLDARWINSFSRAVQIHSGMVVAERTYKEPFDGCIVLGWYKGRKDYYASEKQGRQVMDSVFSRGWINPGAPGVLADKVAYQRPQKWKGWESFNVWDYQGGVSKWVHDMPVDLALAQFARTPPITVRYDLVDDYFAQVVADATKLIAFRQREADIVAGVSGGVLDGHVAAIQHRALLNETYPQHFNQCVPAWGGRQRCWAEPLCWEPMIQADPIRSGVYVKDAGDHVADYEKLIQAWNVQGEVA